MRYQLMPNMPSPADLLALRQAGWISEGDRELLHTSRFDAAIKERLEGYEGALYLITKPNALTHDRTYLYQHFEIHIDVDGGACVPFTPSWEKEPLLSCELIRY